jgi:hypothetical protein
MADYYEIDFRQVHTSKSGDAIAIRYQIGEHWYVHLVDGGYATTAPDVTSFIRNTYGTNLINHMVVTHPDRDHAEGLAPILEEFNIGALWMLRPWNYAAILLQYFPRYESVEALAKRLREEYPYIYELEKISDAARRLYLRAISGRSNRRFSCPCAFSRTIFPACNRLGKNPADRGGLGILGGLMQMAKPVIRLIRAGWGSEKFSNEPTSVENEMSVVQYANLCGNNIVLTGDAGRDGMMEAADYAPYVGLVLPGVKVFQAPLHGGRRNLSTEILNRRIGPRLTQKLPEGQEIFWGMISSAKEDSDHPRKAVLRALLHRGGRILTTEDCAVTAYNNTSRKFTPLPNVPYPNEQEED